MASFNHLKNREAQNKILVVSFGRVRAKGHLCWSRKDGGQTFGFNALGEGEWDGCEGSWYKGIEILPANYHFRTGAKATAMTTGAQTVNPFFPKDVPHSRTPTIAYEIPADVAPADTASEPPLGYEGIFRTKKTPDFSSAGVQTDFSYSPSPARCIVELLLSYARMPNLPAAWVSYAAYWLNRIDWGAWTDYRECCQTTETVDYTTIPDFEGIGLTASFYSGTNFQTFVSKRIEPNINFSQSMLPPFAQLSANNFSARFEGFIEPEFSELYTFSFVRDNSLRFWIAPVGSAFGTPLIDVWQDDGLTPTGGAPNTATIALTGGTRYQIKIEWNDGGAPSQLVMSWSSPSQTSELVPSKRLYPKPDEQAIEECHIPFVQPTHPSAAINEILRITNSFKQDVNGKLRFFHRDQITSSFAFDQSNIIDDTFNFTRDDLLMTEPVTEYEAKFRDLDSRYLEEPTEAIAYRPDWLNRKTMENVKVVELYNTTRWRAMRTLRRIAERETNGSLSGTFESFESKSYPVVSGDRVSIAHRKLGAAPVVCEITESPDKPVTYDDSGTANPARRAFKFKEVYEEQDK